MKVPRSTLLAVMALMLGLAGCQQSAVASRDTMPAAGGRALATDGARLQRAERHAGLADQPGIAWYDERLDHPPAAYAGYVSPIREFSATITLDRQRSFDGRVRDTYQQRTRRGRVLESVR